MTREAQDLEYQKNLLYRDHYRVALGGTVFMVLLCVLLTVVFVFMNISQRQAKYYATTTTGLVIPLHSLSEPVITKSYMLQWASLATRAAYNLNFTDYDQQLIAANQYFTPDGFVKFKAALDKSGFLKTLISKKLIMSAIVSGDPVILHNYIEDGRQNWVIQLPLLLTFVSASEKTHMHMVVTLRVQRVPTLGARNGIQINDFSAG